MQYWRQLLMAAAGAMLLMAFFASALRKRKQRKQRDFTRSLETLLQPKETIKVICPQKRGHSILTNNRIILEEKGKFSAFPLKEIQKVTGKNKEGNRTTVPARMTRLTIQADREITLYPTGSEFEDLAAQLAAVMKKRKEKQKKSVDNNKYGSHRK